jgi:hypothetical protein
MLGLFFWSLERRAGAYEVLSCASQSSATAAVQDWSWEPKGSPVKGSIVLREAALGELS